MPSYFLLPTFEHLGPSVEAGWCSMGDIHKFDMVLFYIQISKIFSHLCTKHVKNAKGLCISWQIEFFAFSFKIWLNDVLKVLDLCFRVGPMIFTMSDIPVCWKVIVWVTPVRFSPKYDLRW